MTKIRITLYETHTHIVYMENPCFFLITEKVIGNGTRFTFMKVYDTLDGNRYDSVTILDEEVESICFGRLFEADTKVGDPITAYQFQAALEQAQDAINDGLIELRRHIHGDCEPVTEPDEDFEEMISRIKALPG